MTCYSIPLLRCAFLVAHLLRNTPFISLRVTEAETSRIIRGLTVRNTEPDCWQSLFYKKISAMLSHSHKHPQENCAHNKIWWGQDHCQKSGLFLQSFCLDRCKKDQCFRTTLILTSYQKT